jgi:hypothetical protein
MAPKAGLVAFDLRHVQTKVEIRQDPKVAQMLQQEALVDLKARGQEIRHYRMLQDCLKTRSGESR